MQSVTARANCHRTSPFGFGSYLMRSLRESWALTGKHQSQTSNIRNFEEAQALRSHSLRHAAEGLVLLENAQELCSVAQRPRDRHGIFNKRESCVSIKTEHKFALSSPEGIRVMHGS